MNPAQKAFALVLILAADLAVVHAEEIFVRANQVGYLPQDTKIAIAFSRSSLPDSFVVVAADSGAAAFQGRTRPVTGVK